MYQIKTFRIFLLPAPMSPCKYVMDIAVRAVHEDWLEWVKKSNEAKPSKYFGPRDPGFTLCTQGNSHFIARIHHVNFQYKSI